MAQLRHDYAKFEALNAEVLVIIPNGPKLIEKHVREYATPYPILSDKGSMVADKYLIETKRIVVLTAYAPSVFLVDRMGKVRYAHYASSYVAEPDNNEPLAELARLTH